MGNIFSPPTREERPVVRAQTWEPTPVYVHREPAQVSRRPLNPVPTRAPCPYYSRGLCARGNACSFSHDGPVRLEVSRPAVRPCHFFAGGYCRKGDKCNFSHDAQLMKGMGKDEKESQDDEVVENWTRELGGAWAKFGDGAKITKISLPSDFSAIRITNLPSTSSVTSVIDLLADVGITIRVDQTRLMKPANFEHYTAIVKVDDPNFAKEACTKLRTCITLRNLEVTSIPVHMPQGSQFHQVDGRKVHCSWHRPTRIVSLIFGNRGVAFNVQKKFKTGKYKVLGSTLTTHQRIDRHDQAGEVSWAIKLLGLPDTVKERDINDAIDALERPRRIEIGEPSYVADMTMDSTLVKSMLYEFGHLERWDVAENSKGKRVNAHATFFEESEAREAASKLNQEPLPFYESGKLFTEVVTSVKFKVSTRVYGVIRNQIEAKKKLWERQYVRLFAFPPRAFYQVLKLEGDNRQKVAQAQTALEQIIDGRVMMMDGKAIWKSGLNISALGYRKLRDIEKKFGVVIIRDVHKLQFRVFGPEEKHALATEALQQLIEEISSASHVINLDQLGAFEWVAGGGLKRLKSEIGHDKVAFDRHLRSICIHGTGKDLEKAKLVISRRQPEAIKGNADSEDCCPICFCEPEEPVRTSCNHTYCGLCFVNMCQLGADRISEFNIRCEGGSRQCGKSLLLPEIQNVVLSETFEDILAASFASHIRRHPDKFRYCPTPDCGQIYRVASASAESTVNFTCKKCLASICTACHVSHHGTTCAELKGDATGGLQALNKMKKNLGIKDCPRCGMAIEKISGCNHMTCPCGAHVCWVCMATFNGAGTIYDHMRTLHGGIGV